MTECNERASLQPRSIPARLRESVGTFTNFTVNNLELGMTVAAWCCHQTSAPLRAGAGWGSGGCPRPHTREAGMDPPGLGLCLPGATPEPWQESIPQAGSTSSQLGPAGWDWGWRLHASSSPARLSSPCSGQRCQDRQTGAEGRFSVL